MTSLEELDEQEFIKQSAPKDYWSGGPQAERWYFPDGIQWIEFMPLTHGQRSAYMAKINRELVIEKGSGNARMKTDLMGDANQLIDFSCVGWYVLRQGQEVPFSHLSPGSTLQQFMQQADPQLIDSLEAAIRQANPWLLGEQKSSEIREQINQLEKDYQEAIEREEGKEHS